MIRCIGTKRDDKDRVLGYYLIDKNKFKKYIEKNKLKALIRGGKLQVVNLTLTSDNRLVFKGIKEKTENANQQKEVTSKKSLKEIVSECGKGYDYEGLHYTIGFRAANVVVSAFSQEIKSVKILNGTEEILPYAFYCCRELKNIEIPNSVTYIGDFAFTGCSSLTTIKIPDSVIDIGDGLFVACESLRYIKIPKRFEETRFKLGCNRGVNFEFY